METQAKVALPDQYNKRYTMEYLAWSRKLETGEEIRDMVAKLKDKLRVSTRTIYNWMKEEKGSNTKEISPKAKEVFAEFFGIAPEQVLSENWSSKN